MIADNTSQRALETYARQKLAKPLFVPEDAQSPDLLSSSFASARHYLQKASQLKRDDGLSLRLGIGFIDASSPNAFAALSNDTPVIGLHVGLAATVFEFAQFVFSQSTVFSRFGNPSNEADPQPHEGYEPGLWSRAKGAHLNADEYNAAMQHLVPRDPDRQLAATYLAHLMLRFAWFHEHFHIVNGHVGWLCSVQGSTSLLEIADENDTADSQDRCVAAEDLRLLELDADRSAFHALCRSQIAGDEAIHGLGQVPLIDRMELSLFAVYAMTWLFDAYGRTIDADRGRGGKHPDPYMRLHNLLRTYASNVFPHAPDAAAVNRRALTVFSQLSKSVSSMPKVGRVLLDLDADALQSGLSEAEDALETLRLEFWPFAYHEE